MVENKEGKQYSIKGKTAFKKWEISKHKKDMKERRNLIQFVKKIWPHINSRLPRWYEYFLIAVNFLLGVNGIRLAYVNGLIGLWLVLLFGVSLWVVTDALHRCKGIYHFYVTLYISLLAISIVYVECYSPAEKLYHLVSSYFLK